MATREWQVENLRRYLEPAVAESGLGLRAEVERALVTALAELNAAVIEAVGRWVAYGMSDVVKAARRAADAE
jgi:hypothetical protein